MSGGLYAAVAMAGEVAPPPAQKIFVETTSSYVLPEDDRSIAVG